MGKPRWLKLVQKTGMEETKARIISDQLHVLGTLKGQLINMPDNEAIYILDKIEEWVDEVHEARMLKEKFE